MLQQKGCPAWLVTLGVNDWQYERRLILQSTNKNQRLARRASDEATG